jgi:hypothetical protein
MMIRHLAWLLLPLIAGCTPVVPKTPATAPAGSHILADFSSPVATYRTYVQAIKANDLKSAAACWAPSDKNEATFVEVVAGGWIASHRLNGLIATKFKGAGDDLKKIVREDCTDAALDRTLDRLSESEAKIHGDVGELVVKWKQSDGGGQDAVFEFSTEPHYFHQVGDTWRLDVAKTDGNTKSEELLAPGTWGSLWKGSVEMLNGIMGDVESGKIVTSKDLQQAIEDRTAVLQAKYVKEMRDRETQRRAALNKP